MVMIMCIGDGLRLLAGGQDAEAEEQRDHDDLQHAGVGHGLHEVAGEDVDDGLDERRRGLGLIRKLVGGKGVAAANVEHVRNDQADDDGACGGAQVVRDGLAADGADLLDIGQADDAGDHGEDDQRHHDHLDEVQEDGAQGLDVGGGDIRGALQGKAGHDAQGQRNENPRGKGKTFEPRLVGVFGGNRFRSLLNVCFDLLLKVIDLGHVNPL